MGGPGVMSLSLRLMAWIRMYCLLPGVSCAVVCVALYQGTDSLSIFFNTLAVVFVLQVDDAICTSLLPEDVRLEVETATLQVSSRSPVKQLGSPAGRVLLVAVSTFLSLIVAHFVAAGFQ